MGVAISEKIANDTANKRESDISHENKLNFIFIYLIHDYDTCGRHFFEFKVKLKLKRVHIREP